MEEAEDPPKGFVFDVFVVLDDEEANGFCFGSCAFDVVEVAEVPPKGFEFVDDESFGSEVAFFVVFCAITSDVAVPNGLLFFFVDEAKGFEVLALALKGFFSVAEVFAANGFDAGGNVVSSLVDSNVVVVPNGLLFFFFMDEANGFEDFSLVEVENGLLLDFFFTFDFANGFILPNGFDMISYDIYV